MAERGLMCGSNRVCMWQQEGLYVAAGGLMCGSRRVDVWQQEGLYVAVVWQKEGLYVAARGCICGSSRVCMWQQVWQWCGSNTGFWTGLRRGSVKVEAWQSDD